ncbi:unnamed protein product, partial [Ixodes pacificus]
MGTTRRERGDLQLSQKAGARHYKPLQQLACQCRSVLNSTVYHAKDCASFLGGDASHELLRGCKKYSRCSTSAAHRYCFSRCHGMKEVASLPSKQLRYTTSTGLQLQLAHGYRSASCTACSSKCR